MTSVDMMDLIPPATPETEKRGGCSAPSHCSAFEADVLAHTAKNGRYVTDEARVIEMGKVGLLHDYGPQNLAGGMHYLTITPRGREVLADYREENWKEKPIKSLTASQRRYRDWQSADSGLTFKEWLRCKR